MRTRRLPVPPSDYTIAWVLPNMGKHSSMLNLQIKNLDFIDKLAFRLAMICSI